MPWKRKQNKKPFRKKRPVRKKLYRPTVPRTMQLASSKPKSVMLRFYQNYEYYVDSNPGAHDLHENKFLLFRANSIRDMNITHANAAGTFNPVDAKFASGFGLDCKGYNDWKGRYEKYTVISSKIGATFNPINSPSTATAGSDPLTFYILKVDGETNGSGTDISISDKVGDIQQKPYLKRTIVTENSRGTAAGGRLYTTWSAKKWNTLSNITDNKDVLAGNLDGSTGAYPAQSSFFCVGLVDSLGEARTSNENMRGILHIRLSYNVLLTDPATDVSIVPQAGIVAHSEL